ncbi:hypothetical protein BDY19DRAFT_915193 [Irpex rosettiformis]|uniref:Uncharacterized protein n=1 Tax=Irpex rosettiformis TaxID=378272 RepID=A0ACB8UKJ1_9APHY|nr:hypothetical protein BDY19DRAFT_915193 [Irpex rosettiformis]
MRSPFRTILLGLNVLVFSLLITVGNPTVITPAAAAPLPFIRDTDYASHPHQNTTTPVFVKHVQQEGSMSRRGNLSDDDTESIRPRDINTVLGNINILNNYSEQMTEHASNFRELYHQSPRSENFEAQSADEVTAFRENLNGFQDILAQLGADKGLANYDRSDQLETLLKNLVNTNKDLLKSVDATVYQLPAVGGTLGPIVYDIKCILDETLDAVENLTDAIINAIKPLLVNLISDASRTACNSGLAVLGLCILP